LKKAQICTNQGRKGYKRSLLSKLQPGTRKRQSKGLGKKGVLVCVMEFEGTGMRGEFGKEGGGGVRIPKKQGKEAEKKHRQEPGLDNDVGNGKGEQTPAILCLSSKKENRAKKGGGDP